jgi:hypothetical protein
MGGLELANLRHSMKLRRIARSWTIAASLLLWAAGAPGQQGPPLESPPTPPAPAAPEQAPPEPTPPDQAAPEPAPPEPPAEPASPEQGAPESAEPPATSPETVPEVGEPQPPAPPATEPVLSEPAPGVPAGNEPMPQPTPGLVEIAPQRAPIRLYRDACAVRAPEEEDKLDAAQRKLFETVCRANRWFDGLFGDEAPDASKLVTGRVELGGVYSDYEGFDSKTRMQVRWQFPNMNKRLNAFIGRVDEEDVELDRPETIAMRSGFFDLEDDEEWLAGLGYSLPGSGRRRSDIAAAAKLSSAPELLVRARVRWVFYPGERTAFRLREAALWQNRDGFGLTSTVDLDNVLSDNLLLRTSARATFGEWTEGAEWRGALDLYQNLRGDHAVLWELFATGETEAEVPLQEYGARIIFRQRFLIDGVHIVTVLGYSWPREFLIEEREGSGTLGLSLEVSFGRWLAAH